MGGDIFGELCGDMFGFSTLLSTDGDNVVFGAPSNDENWKCSGLVHLYECNRSQWSQFGGDIDRESNADQFDMLMSLPKDGLTITIGAPANDGGGEYRGQFCVFEHWYWSKVRS